MNKVYITIPYASAEALCRTADAAISGPLADPHIPADVRCALVLAALGSLLGGRTGTSPGCIDVSDAMRS